MPVSASMQDALDSGWKSHMVNLILRELSPKVLSEYCGDSERVPQTGELVVTQPEVFNYETVIQSLRDF